MIVLLIGLLVLAGLVPQPARAQFGISTHGGAGAEMSEELSMVNWCRDRLAPMHIALSSATAQYAIGNYDKAMSILRNGLHAAARNIGRPYARSMTSISLKRGVALADKLATYPGATGRASALFLSEYYEFVFKVADEIDVRYYRAGGCGYCNQTRIRDLEEKILRFAVEQASLPLDKLTAVSDQVYPIGPVRVYLSITEAMTRFAVADLTSGPYGYQYSCAVGEMKSVAKRIQAYLKGHETYIDDVDAVNTSYWDLKAAISSISCH